jgi:hypothetical protein
VRSGSWLLQNPLLGGYSATEAFDSQGNYSNSSDKVFRSIGAYLAPDDPPPTAKN